MYSQMSWDETALHLCLGPPQAVSPVWSRENIRRTQVEGHSTKYLTIVLPNAKVMKSRERLRDHHGWAETEETR